MISNDKNRRDFKNQLGIIVGLAEMLLAETPNDNPRRRDFEDIHGAATAALDLLARVFPDDAASPR